MSDDHHLSKDLLQQAKQNATRPSKKKTRMGLILGVVGGLLGVTALTLGGIAVYNATVVPNFEGDWALTQNVPENVHLVWDATGDFKGDIEKTPTGDWALNLENGALTNPEYPGCQMMFTQLGGDTGEYGNDKEDTARYRSEFFNNEETSNSTAWVTIKDTKGKETGRLQMERSEFMDEENNYSVAYYRNTPLNASVLLGFIRCEDETTLKTLIDLESKNINDLDQFNIWLKEN